MLLKLYQDDLMAAVRHRTEAATLRRIDFCCRIPVLRHSPFKELQQVCTNVTEKLFEPGAVIVQQGKEATHVHIVLEGEVRSSFWASLPGIHQAYADKLLQDSPLAQP